MLTIIAIAALLLFWRRHRQTKRPGSEDDGDESSRAELPGESKKQAEITGEDVHEAEQQSKSNETDKNIRAGL
jgi:hypothetical protein